MSVSFKVKNNNAFKNIVDNHQFTVDCPNCKSQLQFFGNQIGTTIACPFCKKAIELIDDDFSKNINDIEKSLNNLFK